MDKIISGFPKEKAYGGTWARSSRESLGHRDFIKSPRCDDRVNLMRSPIVETRHIFQIVGNRKKI